MIVRAAAAGDVAAMAAIAEASYRVAFADILEPEALAARDAAFFDGFFADKIASCRVAERDGRVVAFAKTTDRKSTRLNSSH